MSPFAHSSTCKNIISPFLSEYTHYHTYIIIAISFSPINRWPSQSLFDNLDYSFSSVLLQHRGNFCMDGVAWEKGVGCFGTIPRRQTSALRRFESEQ